MYEKIIEKENVKSTNILPQSYTKIQKSLCSIIGESKLELILNKLYKSDEIIKSSYADFIIKRNNKPTILFKNNDYTSQVKKSEISKFINNIENNNCCGIFISQYSGITNKKNFQIEIHKNNILIYLTFVEYNSDKLSVAVDIIDDLSKKLDLVNNNMLEQINNEYLIFATKKEHLISNFYEQTNKNIDLLSDLELPSLCNYLSTN